MSDFSQIMALSDVVIHATFGSTDVTYTRPGLPGITGLTVVFDHGQELMEAGTGQVSERTMLAHIIASDLTHDPARGDSISDGTDTWTVERVLFRDEDNLVITVELKRQ